MKLFYYILFFIFFLYSCDKEKLYTEQLTDKFYKNVQKKNYKSVDSLIIFRFYQRTPYNKFIKILENNKNEFGDFRSKSLKKYDRFQLKNKTDVIQVEYEVIYSKASTKESLTLIKEDKTFRIFEYFVSINE